MNKSKLIRLLIPLLFIAVGAVFLFYPDNDGKRDDSEQYFVNQGHVFGTYYNIRYQASRDLQDEIIAELQRFDNSLSAFNSSSVISLVNRNESDKVDTLFENMFTTAERISELSDGAFDITVAPLVNAWGFGFKNKETVTSSLIDSLLDFVGYKKVSLSNHRLVKTDSRVMLDASAIAKGYACDVIAALLRKYDVWNYLVDIGGEVACSGISNDGNFWRIGIDKPQDDTRGTRHELQGVVSAASVNVATSGNYRQFYYENGIRRSHTIDPRSGYPVNHGLLSATVIAPSCMQADAIATACMVMGTQKALEMTEKMDKVESLLIYSVDNDSTAIVMTSGMKKYMIRKTN